MTKISLKNISEKLKTDKRTRNTVICSVAGAVVVIAAAIVIPVGVHSSNVKKALADEQAAQIAVSDEANVIDDTAASAAATEPETEEATAEVTVPATDEPTQAANSESSTNKGTSSNTDKGSSSGNNGGSGSSGSGASSQKPNSESAQNNPPAQQETPAEPEQPIKKNPELDWTQADVDAAVAEAQQYAKSKGLIIDSSLTEKGTSWSSPIDTRLDYKSNAAGDLHYKIDNSLIGISDELIEAGIVTINIFSINYGSYWEIYVVY